MIKLFKEQDIFCSELSRKMGIIITQLDEYDRIIVAEISNKDDTAVLFDTVTQNIVHGPCKEWEAQFNITMYKNR